MENASKALIIAGAVLVAILIVSLGVLIFNNFSQADLVDLDAETINAFNSKLTSYIGTSIAGSQVNALLQYCLSNNMKAYQSGETYKYINVYQDGVTDPIINNTSTNYTKVTTGGAYYTVNGVYDSNGLLTKITIRQN